MLYTNCHSCTRKFGENEDNIRIDVWDRARKLSDRYYLEVCRGCLNKFEAHFEVKKKPPRVRMTKKEKEEE